MVVGEWITGPELHGPDRSGGCPRWRLDSFSAQFCFTWLDCLQAEGELLRAIRKKQSSTLVRRSPLPVAETTLVHRPAPCNACRHRDARLQSSSFVIRVYDDAGN